MSESLEFSQPIHVVSAIDDPTIVVRGDKRYLSGTQDEFDVLSKLYTLAPDHVAKPLQVLRENDKVIGYQREEIPGQTLYDYIRQHKFVVPDAIKQQITQTLTVFHQHGLAHGDPNEKNILITPEGTVKFIDPAGYNLQTADQQELQILIDWDNERIHEMMETIDFYTSHPDQIP